jgi:hypothetical protein
MGEFKFNCPSCSQKIQCTEDWVGYQIQCPGCQQNIQVPAPPAPAAAPEPKPPAKVGLGLAAHQKTAPPPVATFSHGTNPMRHVSPSRTAASDTDKADKIKRIVMIAACVLLIPPAGYFGFSWIRDYQAKLNVKRQQTGADSDGGRMGHIATLYDALDATDPNKYSRFGDGAAEENKRYMERKKAEAAAEEIIPPTWTLEIDKVKLQRGKVNGSVAGTNFVAATAFLDVKGAMNVLSLRDSTNFYADRELFVYLKLKPGENLIGQSWTIAPDTRTNVPNVIKKWRSNPRVAPQQKSFPTGYAMKLEFLNQSDELVQGRIYLALPDTEQSVVAGQFNATLRTPRPVAALPASATRPQQPQQRRY